MRRKQDELMVPEVPACMRVIWGSVNDCRQSPELPARALVKRDKLGVGFGGSSVSSGVLVNTVLTTVIECLTLDEMNPKCEQIAVFQNHRSFISIFT